jgi:hypothetical protein
MNINDKKKKKEVNCVNDFLHSRWTFGPVVRKRQISETAEFYFLVGFAGRQQYPRHLTYGYE